MYQALYRKYRPQTFDEVVGQDSITRTLKNQVMTDKLSHAYLFTGTRGTGKTSCAKILAKAVNCLSPVDGNPCNHCSACRSIDSGACMDVLEIDAASNNGVDNVRVLRDDAVYTPSEVKKRVYIIDEVHMLSTAAFNALLKIIEEPPEHLIFILATTELHKVPATILSRCQRFSFRRLLPEDIASRLNFAAYEEGIEIEPAAIRLLARLADGALRDGLSLLDQCYSGTSGAVSVQSVLDSLGLAGEQKTAELLQAVASHDTAAALRLFSSLYSGGKDLAAMLDELCAAARDLLLLKTAPKSGVALLSGVCLEQELESLGQRLTAGELFRIVSVLQSTLAALKTSVNDRITAELCLVELCDPTASLDAQALNARLSRVEQTLRSGVIAQGRQSSEEKESAGCGEELDAPPWDDADVPPLPDDKDDPAQAQQPTPVPAGAAPEPVGFWPDLLAALRPELPLKIKGFFAPAGPVQPNLQGGVLYLMADSAFVRDMVAEPGTLKLVADKATAVLGRPVAVKVALKGQLDAGGKDKFQELLCFGSEHQEIVTIK